jgi:hypothetical protein
VAAEEPAGTDPVDPEIPVLHDVVQPQDEDDASLDPILPRLDRAALEALGAEAQFVLDELLDQCLPQLEARLRERLEQRLKEWLDSKR